ncbi:fibronectin type III domain-containing protein [Lacinutrix jangbogonensis]|uniref:fibronectin type III domain-containing protein n=1 Tax=Lacinutrix jangbogonensis TaxID=1469557 RepID=UPI000B0C186E|nr:fibronectin type III domain-containing protein [Lacinutrix jangbogonensis]
MKKDYYSVFIAFLFCVSVFSQNKIWEQPVTVNNLKSVSEKPLKQKTFKFNANIFLNQLVSAPKRFSNKNSNSIISLPNEFGVLESYKIFESSNFDPVLANKYPQIKSYIGINTVTGTTARISYSPSQGLHAFVSNLERATTIIKPLDVKNNLYTVFSRSDLSQDISDFECSTMESVMTSSKFINQNNNSFNADDQNLRLYRLAVSTTGEYSQYFLDGTEVDDIERINKVLAAINTALVRINGIFERDFSVTMQLIANNDLVIFLDSNSDPYNGVSNTAVQNELDATIGNANYDVGHLFAFEGSVYGNAGCIACVCTSGDKGQAYTVHSAPDSDNFYMIASHEFGHQFGGFHVQSSSNCRSSAGLQEVEPGSGSSIMGYAGICPANVQNTPDDYFNYVDIRDVAQWTINDSSCSVLMPLTNNAPTVMAGGDFTIPISTAFVLEGQGNDIDSGDTLSFCWEENDPEDPSSINAPSPTRVQGPMFRSKLPISIPDRYMPQLSDVISGNITPTWEVVPSIGRTMDFVLTVRDNALNGGQTASDEMTVTVDASSGPFTVSSQATTENWDVGSSVTITWDVANTNLSPINASNVDVFLSIDGGYTYPYTLISNTLNDGSETIIVPNVPTTSQARVMVKAANNIFYALNASDINIQASEFVMNFANTSASICQPNDAVYNFTYNTFLGFNATTTFSVDNLPVGVTASFNPMSANANGTNVMLTISNTVNFAVGDYNLIVKGNATNVEKSAQISLSVFNNSMNTPILIAPANNANGIDLSEQLTWQADINASNFEIEIATDINFTNVIDSAILTDNFFSASNLEYNTTYFWHVRSVNDCLTTMYSNTFEFLTSCIAPSNITVSNVLIDTAEISWTENGNASTWEVEIVLSNTAPSGVGVITASNPYLATNLNSFTTYDVYVRSICSGSNFSTWEGPISFTTTEDFCSGDNFYDTGGPNGTYSNGENYTTTISPSAGFNSVSVQFNSFSTEGCCDFLRIYDGPDNSYPLIGSFGGNNSPGSITSSDTSGALTFVFTSDGSVTSSGWDASVICESISCPNPSNLQFTNIDTTSADVSWLAGSTETQWELEYGVSGFVQGTGTLVQQVNTNSNYQISNLNLATTYNVFVKANCGVNSGDDDSAWIGPVSFTTLDINPPSNLVAQLDQNSGDVILNWNEPVSNSVVGNWILNYDFNCNNNYNQAGITFNADFTFLAPSAGLTGTWVLIGNQITWTYDDNGFQYNGTIVGNYMSGTMGTAGCWFADKQTSLNSSYDFIIAELEPNGEASINAGVNYTFNFSENSFMAFLGYNLYRDNVLLVGSIVGTTYTDTLPNYGTYDYYVTAIYDEGESTQSNTETVLWLSCPEPSNPQVSNISSDTVDLSWLAGSSETQWEVEYGQTGFTQGFGTIMQTTLNTNYPLTGLSGLITYEVYVRANCGNNPGDDDSIWVGPVSFTTAISCPDPSNLQVSNISDTTVDVSWLAGSTETQWEVELGQSGFTQGAGVLTQTTLNTNYPLTGLTPSSAYDVYVRANCGVNPGDDDSSWIGPMAFTALCGTFIAPYIEDVETHNATTTSNISNCWSSSPNNTNNAYRWDIVGNGGNTPSPDTGPNSANSGLKYFYTEASGYATGDVAELYSPIIDISSLTVPQLSFYYHMYGVDMGSLHVDVLNNGVWTNNLLILSGQQQNSSSAAWIEQTLILNGFTGEVQIRFRGIRGNNFRSDMSIDDIRIIDSPTCPDPSNLQVSNISSTTADLSWLAGNTETQWQVEHGLTGFVQGTGILTQTGLNTNYPLTGLTPSSTYDVYFRANCEPNPGADDSSWIGPIAFNTLCGVIVAPFYEDFSTFTTPNCWQESGSESWNYNTFADYQAANAGDHTSGGGTNYAWINGSTPNGPGQISNLRTMAIDVSPLAEPVLKFSIYSYNTDDFQYNTLNVIVHNGTGASQNVLQLQGSTGGWMDYIIDLTTITSSSNIIEIEFTIEENSPADPYFNDILIDDISVESNGTLGTDQFDLEGFSFYPNPVKDMLYLSHISTISKIEVFSILGQSLFYSTPQKNETQIDMSNYAIGTYFVRVEVNGGFKIIKVIKE